MAQKVDFSTFSDFFRSPVSASNSERFYKHFGSVLGEFWGNLEDQKFNFSDRVLEDNTGVCQGGVKSVCYGKVCLVNALCLQRQ